MASADDRQAQYLWVLCDWSILEVHWSILSKQKKDPNYFQYLHLWYFFNQHFGCPMASFESLTRTQPQSPDVNHCKIYQFTSRMLNPKACPRTSVKLELGLLILRLMCYSTVLLSQKYSRIDQIKFVEGSL